MSSKNQDTRGIVVLTIVMIAVLSTMSSMETLSASGAAGDQQRLAKTASGCKRLLDSMDLVFEHQRDARHQVFKKRYPYEPKPQVFFDPYEPEAVCLSEERFGGAHRYGSLGDGPKYVCGMDTLDPKDCLVYNVGSNNQIDFEQAVSQEIGCEIHTFDPTLRKPYIGGNYSHFYPYGLGVEGMRVQMGRGPIPPPFYARSIESIVKELNHTARKIDILKIDCEGCEYTVMPLVFQAIQNGTMLPFDQIQIEVHALSGTPEKKYKEITRFFQTADDAGYRIFHKERNHWGCAGYMCVEYSLAHKSFLRRANAAVVCDYEYYSSTG